MNSHNPDVVEDAIERRKVRDPEMIHRIRSELLRAASGVHRRRLREWAADDDAEFPTETESQRIAIVEVELLIRSLGKYAGIPGEDLFTEPLIRMLHSPFEWE
ncbi:hypothetical protein GOARA_013_00040 [Gordonia araii NBRC 100433]|uniref:Uncharacterized protein n=2 Tax=Gordonia TaxID=2053 RepID=A0A7M4BQ28_9ACTN|nr:MULTISPECIES: hypothetical protein [Gordonia]GAB08560.1 hypothetical protein GOARA_013_00040 [Gordonia araii NBRC 100433]GED95989.1 hypothetical protein nbrc107697_00280 [Gordonia crocea]